MKSVKRQPVKSSPSRPLEKWLFRRLAHLVVFLFLASARVVLAGAGDFETGNQLYDQGKFSEARARYENLSLAGEWTPNLFYNLGNCDYRLGEPGRAILDYERALALDPGHPEARANLALLRNQTGAKTPAPSWEQYAFTGLSQNAWAIAAAAASWIAVFGLAALATSRRHGAGMWLATIAAALVAAYGGGVLWLTAQERGLAIVVAKSVEARLAPADSAGLADELPAGSRVRVLSERGDWIYCELPTQSRGWIPQSAIEKVRLGKS
jgi:tetratricopeptide (TPR) repeat protein